MILKVKKCGDGVIELFITVIKNSNFFVQTLLCITMLKNYQRVVFSLCNSLHENFSAIWSFGALS